MAGQKADIMEEVLMLVIGKWKKLFIPFPGKAVAAGALSVMRKFSYNEIDGIPCTANSNLLTGLLKKRWQFKGFVVSDLLCNRRASGNMELQIRIMRQQ